MKQSLIGLKQIGQLKCSVNDFKGTNKEMSASSSTSTITNGIVDFWILDSNHGNSNYEKR
jgi:hypothetical protein